MFAVVLLAVGVAGLVQTVGTGGDGASPPSESESEARTAPASPTAGEDSAVEPTGDAAEEPASAEPTDADPTSADPTAELTERHDGIVQSGTVGDGTWTIAEPATETEQAAEQTAETVHTYALRVENGTQIDAAAAAAEVAAVLADPRGWQGTDGVFFQQVSDPEQANFTISIASPPTVDELCAPARTGGVWSCRIGPDVALNSDRWLHLTPTYDDAAEYRAYLVNHEVGHYLGHQHAACGVEGLAAPVMLQQSIDLEGCRANAWPAQDGQN